MSIWEKRRARGQLALATSHHDEGCSLAVIDHAAPGAPALVRADWFAGDPAHSTTLLARRAREQRLGRVSCVGLVEAHDYSLVLVDTPEVPPAELRAATRWRVKDLIDFHIDDAVIDVFHVPVEESRTARRMYAVVARSERVARVVSAARTAGLALDVVDIPEFALRNLAVRLPENDKGLALIHFGVRHGLLAVIRRDALYFARRLDGGSERLLNAGTTLTPVMEGLFDALTIEIQRSLDFYERHFAQPPIGALVLAGLPTHIDGMPEYLQSQLGIATRCFDVAEICAPPAAIPRDVLARCALAIGAALRTQEHAA